MPRRTIIPWERDTDGREASVLDSNRTRLKVWRLSAKGIAIAKMLDVDLISAEFGGMYSLFERQAFVLMEHNKRIDFISLHVPSANDEDMVSAAPSICVRRATWDHRGDLHQAALGLPLRGYLAGPDHCLAEIIFLPHSDKSWTGLVSNLKALAIGGIATTQAARPDAPWERLRVSVSADGIVAEAAYCPYSRMNIQLEQIVREIIAWSSSVGKGILSDRPPRLSPRKSVTSWIRSFPATFVPK